MINPNDPDMNCDFTEPIAWHVEEEETSSICPVCAGAGTIRGCLRDSCHLCGGSGEVELDENGNKRPDNE